MKDRPRVQDFDWPLLAIAGAISAIGVLEIYSSTHASAMAGMQWKQLMWIGDRPRRNVPDLAHRLPHPAGSGPALYLVGVAGLLVVLLLGLFAPGRQALDLARRPDEFAGVGD